MAEGKAKVVANGGLNVRSGAGTNYSKLGSLANGSTVSYQSEQNGWLKINYSNKTGYICKTYTNITQAATNDGGGSNSGDSNASQGSTMYTNATSLNVRKGPSTSYGTVGSLSYGSKVTVLSKESNGWYKISYNSGTAYISGKYVQANNPNGGQVETQKPETKPEEQKPETKPETGKQTQVVVNGSLNIRSAPNTSSSKIGSLQNGETVTYISDKDNWLHITGPQEGYICKTYTKLGSGSNNAGGTFDTGTIGAGGLHYLSTKQVASIETGRKAKTIVDLRTKKQFTVSWDACATYHSDCTPMTTADTTVFKSIRNPNVSADNKSYWGQTSSWSWDARPAAIQLKDGTWVACGYHQRPHAAIMGGNPGHPFQNQSNTRPSTGWAMGGHFCLYYGDSPGGTPKCNDAAREAKNMSL